MPGRIGQFVLVAALLGFLPGCFGVSQNPSYFPHLLPTGDIIRTHAKPPGAGYFSNFDPHAVRLEVRPLESTGPVRSQHVIIATIYDEDGKPRRDRRVEWIVEGVGNIVEVDESGLMPGRGYKVDNKYAVSYTDYREHKFDRGNSTPTDDFVIRPGQTWCVISSAVEGDTHVTVYAPEIHDWDKHKVFVTKHWVDAEWVMPQSATVRTGTEHGLTTRVFRHTDHQPLANYRVRYRIADGPPAILLPSRTPEETLATDLTGSATIGIAQVAQQAGINHVAVEVIRAPDPSLPSGSGIVIARSDIAIEWLAPAISLSHSAPATVALGQTFTAPIIVANTGKVECRALTVRAAIPDGLEYVSSQPPAIVEGRQLVWTLGALAAGQQRQLDVSYKASRLGNVEHRAGFLTAEGLRDEKSATTQVTAPQLKVTKIAPATGIVGAAVVYQITVTNPGTGPANNVVLSEAFDKELVHQSGFNPVELQLGALAAGEGKTIPLSLTPKSIGRFRSRITATADGNLRNSADHTVEIVQARVAISISGPKMRYVEQAAVWDIRVSNPNDGALSNVVVRSTLPPQLTFRGASEGGQASEGQVVWNIGTLPPRQEKTIQVTTLCTTATARAVHTITVTAEPNLQSKDEATIEIQGVPAVRLDVSDSVDPIEVGGRTTYKVTVQNQGTLPVERGEVIAELPPQMQFVDARGPTQFQKNGQRVSFSLSNLPARQTAEYFIDVDALQAGDARFRAELTAGTLGPLEVQESTNVLPRGAGAPATPIYRGVPPSSPGRIQPEPQE